MGGGEHQFRFQHLRQLLHSAEGQHFWPLRQRSTGQGQPIRRFVQVGQQRSRLFVQVSVLLPELAGALPQAGV